MKKSTKIIIAVVSVILVVAIVFAVLYFATDIFKKNPKKAFYEYLDKAAIGEGEFSYSDLIASLKNAEAKSYEGTGKASVDIKLGSEMSGEDYADILEALSNAEISYEVKADPANSKSYTSMNIKYDGEDLGTLELLSSGEEIGIRVEDITDKYLTTTLEEIMEELNIDEEIEDDLDLDMNLDDMSSSLENVDLDEIIDLLDISDDEIKRIAERYGAILKDTIPEDNYSSEKTKITVNGKELDTTAYTVEVSEKDLVNLATKLLESLEDDTDTINLVVDKVNKLMKIAGEDSTTITKAQVKSLIEYALEALEEVDDLGDTKIKIVVYAYKDETARIEIAIDDEAIMIDSLKDGDTTNMALGLKYDGTEMTILNVEQTKKSDNSYTTKVSMDIEEFKVEVTLDTEETDTNSRINMKIYVDVTDVITATLNIEQEVEYKSVSIEKLSSSNSIAMSDLSEEDLMNGLLDYIENHMDAIKAIASEIGYEDEIEEFEDELNLYREQSTQTDATPEDENENSEDAA